MNPIFIPIFSGGSGGCSSDTSLLGVLVTLFSIIYIAQVVVVWCLLFLGEINSRKTLLFWNIPIVPFIVACVNKVTSIGR